MTTESLTSTGPETDQPTSLAQLASLTEDQVVMPHSAGGTAAVARTILAAVLAHQWRVTTDLDRLPRHTPVMALFDDGSTVIGHWGGLRREEHSFLISGTLLPLCNCQEIWTITDDPQPGDD
jgi:hypothetical protein